MLIHSKSDFNALVKAIREDVVATSGNSIKLSSVREIVARALNHKSSNGLIASLPQPLIPEFDVKLSQQLSAEHRIDYAKPLCFLPWPKGTEFTADEFQILLTDSSALQKIRSMEERFQVPERHYEEPASYFRNHDNKALVKLSPDGKGGWIAPYDSLAHLAGLADGRLGLNNIYHEHLDAEAIVRKAVEDKADSPEVIALFSNQYAHIESALNDSGLPEIIPNIIRSAVSRDLYNEAGEFVDITPWLSSPVSEFMRRPLKNRINFSVIPSPWLSPEDNRKVQAPKTIWKSVSDEAFHGVERVIKKLFEDPEFSSTLKQLVFEGRLDSVPEEVTGPALLSIYRMPSVRLTLEKMVEAWLLKKEFWNDPLEMLFEPRPIEPIPSLNSSLRAAERHSAVIQVSESLRINRVSFGKGVLEDMYEDEEVEHTCFIEDVSKAEYEAELKVQRKKAWEAYSKPLLAEFEEGIPECREGYRQWVTEEGIAWSKEEEDSDLEEQRDELVNELKEGFGEEWMAERYGAPILYPFGLHYVIVDTCGRKHTLGGVYLNNENEFPIDGYFEFFDVVSDEMTSFYYALCECEETLTVPIDAAFLVESLYYESVEELREMLQALSDTFTNRGDGKVIVLEKDGIRDVAPGGQAKSCKKLREVYNARVHEFMSEASALGFKVGVLSER